MALVCIDTTNTCGDPDCVNCNPEKRKQAIRESLERGDTVCALFDCANGTPHLFNSEEGGKAYAENALTSSQENIVKLLDEIRSAVLKGECNGLIVTAFSHRGDQPTRARGCAGILPGDTAMRWPETAELMGAAVMAMVESRTAQKN